MKKIVTSLLFLTGYLLSGQNAQLEINEQVWKPFIKTFSANDTEGFMALHSKDLVRSSRDDNSVIDWNQYYKNSRDGELRSKAANRTRTIDLRFLERISSASQAVETGIYKTSSFQADGKVRVSYGQFLVVLRKENTLLSNGQGVWKILVDTDSSEGGTINEQSFLNAKPMSHDEK